MINKELEQLMSEIEERHQSNSKIKQTFIAAKNTFRDILNPKN